MPLFVSRARIVIRDYENQCVCGVVQGHPPHNRPPFRLEIWERRVWSCERWSYEPLEMIVSERWSYEPLEMFVSERWNHEPHEMVCVFASCVVREWDGRIAPPLIFLPCSFPLSLALVC